MKLISAEIDGRKQLIGLIHSGTKYIQEIGTSLMK